MVCCVNSQAKYTANQILKCNKKKYPHSVRIQKNTDQKNSVYEHFLRDIIFLVSEAIFVFYFFENFQFSGTILVLFVPAR